MGSSLARVTCETSQVVLAGGQVVFLGDLPFLPHLKIDSAQNPNQKEEREKMTLENIIFPSFPTII